MICVFDKMTAQNKFHTCGKRILSPESCFTTESLNGDWSLEMTYLITDSDDAWTFLAEWNVIKNNAGQLFVIYYSQPKISAGKSTIQIKARHIFYYLNDKIVYNAVRENYDAWYAIATIMGETNYRIEAATVDYTFSYNSDITDVHKNINYDGISTTYALLGSADSIVNLYGGELHRNNFYFSINKRKECSKDKAFNIVHGINMIEITETTDITDWCTEVVGKDNYGSSFSISWVPTGTFPHHVTKCVRFSYSGESTLNYDTIAYFNQYKFPKVSYDIIFDDLKKTNKYESWCDLERCDVGDTGTIFSGKLGINTVQKVIEKKTDELTGKTVSIKLGNFRPSFIKTDRYSKIIASDSALDRRLDRLEGVVNATDTSDGSE